MRTDRPFTVAQDRAAGLSRKQLRHRRLAPVLRGVRVDAVLAEDLLARCAAALLVAPRGSAISHGTALRVHGIDAPSRVGRDDRIHLSVREDLVAPDRSGLVCHTFSSLIVPTAVVDGLLVTTAEHTWRQLAAVLPVDELVVLGDAMLRRQDPASTVDALQDTVLATPPGTRGVARMRAALQLVRPRTDSPMETRTRLTLVRLGLPCPVVNHTVLDDRGGFVALVDMAYVAERVAVEYDGDIHRVDRRTWQRDIERKRALEDLGWRVVTVTADDVYAYPERLAARVRALLRSR